MKDYRNFFNHIIDVILYDMFNIIHVEIGHMYKLVIGEGVPVKYIDLKSPRSHILEMLNVDKSDYNNIKSMEDIIYILTNSNIINLKKLEITKVMNADTIYLKKLDAKPYIIEFFRTKRKFIENNESYGLDLSDPPNQLVYVDIIDYHLGINLSNQIRSIKVSMLV